MMKCCGSGQSQRGKQGAGCAGPSLGQSDKFGFHG